MQHVPGRVVTDGDTGAPMGSRTAAMPVNAVALDNADEMVVTPLEWALRWHTRPAIVQRPRARSLRDA
jgi:hypothetical protein